ncbi:MAG TPA: DinB family protein [Pyrinomonadaceae bacterium]
MSIGETFAKDLENESRSGREMLERIPTEKFDWKPHEKSMTMKRLAGLVADMYGWFQFIVDEPELDFAKGYEQPSPETTDDLVKWMDKKFAAGLKSLREAPDARFNEEWKLRRGEQVFMTTTKGEMCRQTFGHLAHHRGQLSVYLRLNDIPVPQIYGPTADEGSM